MNSQRQQKVSKLLYEELSVILPRINKNINNLITITGAKVSPDLSLAKIYISVFPKENRQVVFKDIEKSKPQIRLEIGNSLKNQLRIIPDLRFYLDESIDNVELIEKELKGEGNNPKL